MQISCRSDRGQKRNHNEDSLLCLTLDIYSQSEREEAGLFVVADGMGGHAAGEIASEFIVNSFARWCCFILLNPEIKGVTSENPEKILVAALHNATKELFEKAKEASLHGMGTTLTAALIIGRDLYAINVGDSRCYIINNRETIQVTRDHSIVQDLIATGLIKAEEAKTHPHKSVLTRALGQQEETETDSFQRKLYEGDIVLLCSDGLWNVLSDQEITRTILAANTPEQACNELVAQANKMGGPDNISVIVVRPDHLPSWQESLMVETQVLKISEVAKYKPVGGFLSLFQRRHID